MDNNTKLIELKSEVETFVKARDWEQFHDLKNLSMAIAIEAAELMDLFKWSTSIEVEDVARKRKKPIAEELADVLILCIAFANKSGIDISRAVKSKMNKNKRKYPVRVYKGRFSKQ